MKELTFICPSLSALPIAANKLLKFAEKNHLVFLPFSRKNGGGAKQRSLRKYA